MKYDNPINKKVLVSIHGILERLKYISLFVNALYLIQGVPFEKSNILKIETKMYTLQTSFDFVNMRYIDMTISILNHFEISIFKWNTLYID